MDCNKDEAARAKALAERKMLEKDFVGAKKLIIKAQQLPKEVDDIDIRRMLTVCDVHCAAGAKENGQIDWYGILQVPETADDAQIKKQYHKLALLLHPDKNKFGGAEVAFKLVGEANENLTERVRATQISFWTWCPSCRTIYEYPILALEKVLRCLNKNCLKQFLARERAVVESNISETSSDNEEEMVESSECSISETSSGNEEARVMVESSESSISETSSDSEEEIAENEGIPEKSLEFDPAALSLDMEEDIPSTSSAQVVSIMHGSVVHDLMQQDDSCEAYQQYAGIWKNAGIPQKSPGPQTNATAQKAWSATPGVNLNVASHHVGEHSKRETAANTAGPQDKMKSAHAARNPSKASSTAGLKRRRRAVVESSESSISETSSDCEEEVAEHGPAANGSGLCQRTRTSSWQKQEDEYNEEINDDDDVLNGKVDDFVSSPLKRLRKSFMFHGDHSNKDKDDASDEYEFTSVNPEFFDFGQLRDKNEFRTNQLWAVCDEQGYMPRFYAQITKVKTMPDFMLHFVWLEFNPTNNVEAAWSFSGLPIACGCYKYGKSDTAKETGMFSRSISYEKSKTRNCIEIYPREGEVWALFKGWDIGWSSDPNNHNYWSHQYEVVQVLSDLTMSTSINVMPLVKIKGYDNLFMQSREATPYVIPQGDTLRFSHCIPHHVISAIGERVPEGSIELDRAALPLPINSEMAFTSGIPECSSERSQERDARYASSSSGNSSHEGSMSAGNGRDTTCMNAGIGAKTPKEVDGEHNTTIASHDKFTGNSSCKGSMNVVEGQHTTCMNAGIAAETPQEESRKHNTCSAEVAEVTDVDEDSISQTIYVHAKSDFYDFSQSRLLQKISPGKIWALYSYVDKFPNYYGFIQNVDLKNGKIQFRWLDVCPCGDEEKRLLQEERTIGCGTFRLSRVHELMICTDTIAFSHCVVARSTGQEGEYYEIIPRPREIWAVYKNWRVGWTAQDFGRCEYELVEILGHTGSSVQVQILRKVNGYKTVFMRSREEGSVKTIRKDEYPKFSHQIPCFHLTDENGGKLQGYLELDPYSLPEEFLNVYEIA